MDFQHNFGDQDDNAQPKRVFQNEASSSKHWRSDTRIYHPVTENQMTENNFKVGDHVRMRITHIDNTRTVMYLNIVNIIRYGVAQQVLGSYNANNSFRGAPFTRVLVLEP